MSTKARLRRIGASLDQCQKRVSFWDAFMDLMARRTALWDQWIAECERYGTPHFPGQPMPSDIEKVVKEMKARKSADK